MKRLFTSATLFLCSLLTFAQFGGSGSGTESDPYRISQPFHLNQLRNFLNQEGVYFKLMDDIDLTEFINNENPTQGWQPVGNSSSAAFKGILDGNGKTISGLWINRGSTSYVGFFGYTVGATIKDLTIMTNDIVGNENVGGLSGYSYYSTFSNVSLSATKIQGSNNVGGLVGSSGDNMTLSDNTVAATINASGDNIGGLIGKNNASYKLSISGCHVNDSKITGRNNVGGAVGGDEGSHENYNTISSSYIYANITGNEKVGGICGYSENNYHTVGLSQCGFVGNINGSSYLGGLIGYCKKTSTSSTSRIDAFNRCFAIASISGTSDYVGGLIGYDEGSKYTYSSNLHYTNLFNCYFSGSVSGGYYTAGLVGYKKYGTISNSYCMASVFGGRYVGGLVGYNESSTTLKTSVAINTRVMATDGDVNRLVGYNSGTIAVDTEANKSYNRTIVVDQGVSRDILDNTVNGTSVSAETLKYKSTYEAVDWNWDFTDTWAIQEKECYPYFQTQTAPPVITSDLVSGATTVSGKCIDGGTITLEVDGVKQQLVSSGNTFSFTVNPLQAGHDVRVYAKVEGKEQSYYATQTVAYLGSGTETDPYQVYTAADLTGVYRRGYFKLMNDIDLTSYINQFSPTEGWQSIGREGSETVYFNGDGHKITGLWINSTRENTGLFSCFYNGYIKNLTVEVAEGKQVKGGANTGIIIGKLMNGAIENCKVTGTMSNGTPVGGVVGLLDGGSMTHCEANVTINATEANASIGALAGESKGAISQCFAYGALTATGNNSYVGGLVGKNMSSGSLTDCYSHNTISSSYCAAGIVAYNYGSVDKCMATGNISSQNFGAGIVGYNDGASATVKHCVATSKKLDVTYESQQLQQGGGYGQRILGGHKNGAPDPVKTENYALKTMQLSINDIPQPVDDDLYNGTAKTAEELQSAATYEELGWDMTDIWNLDDGMEQPYFSWDVKAQPKSSQTMALTEIPQKTYGDDDFALPTETEQGQSLEWISDNPEVISITGTTAHIAAAGTAVLTASQEGNDTYTAFSKDFEVTVTKAALTISVGNYNRKEGEANPEFTINYSGWKNNEDASVLTTLPTVTCSADESSAPGNYDITVSGAVASNYDITYTNGKLNVREADAPEPIDVTDISAMDNAIYIEQMEASLGEVVDLPVQMKNTMSAVGCSFRLTLPEGFSLQKDGDGDVIYVLEDRANKMLLYTNERNDGSVDFALTPKTANATISGTDGAFVTFKLVIPETATEGDHALQLTQNLIQSKVDGVTRDFAQSDITTAISVRTYITGDVNGDGNITPSDAIMILYHYFNVEQNGFNVKAADINGDGLISPADAIEALYLYFNAGTSNARVRQTEFQLDPQ